MQFSSLKSFILTLMLVDLVSGSSWTYTNPQSGPSKWAEQHKAMCSGHWQSPIDLNSHQAILFSKKKTISIYYDKTVASPASCTLTNNGHSIQINFPVDYWFVSFDDGVQSEYSVVQLHFHWGGKNTQGSEHTINGQTFPLESHLVCYRKSMYTNVSVAITSTGGLAVLGFMHQISSSVDTKATQLGILGSALSVLNNTIEVGSSHDIGHVNLTNLLQNLDSGSYFRYPGSLTTPPCTENVLWTVFDTPVPVTESQLELLRKQNFSSAEQQTNMYDNFRPVQPLNGPNSNLLRQLYKSSTIKLSSNFLVCGIWVVVSIIGTFGI